MSYNVPSIIFLRFFSPAPGKQRFTVRASVSFTTIYFIFFCRIFPVKCSVRIEMCSNDELVWYKSKKWDRDMRDALFMGEDENWLLDIKRWSWEKFSEWMKEVFFFKCSAGKKEAPLQFLIIFPCFCHTIWNMGKKEVNGVWVEGCISS